MAYAFIQGTRTGKDAPWTDNSGNPLPYLPASVGNSNEASNTKLVIVSDAFYAVDVSSRDRAFVLCEM